MADIAVESKTRVRLEEGTAYPTVGVMMYGQGLLDREPFVGGQTTYTKLTPLEAGQLVLRSITAFEAPIAVVEPRHDGFHVSGVFPVFDLKPSDILPNYMSLVCTDPTFWQAMRERTTGSVLRRMTLSAKGLLDIPLTLPPIAEQRRIVDVIESVDTYIAALEKRAETARTARTALLHDLLSNPGPDWVETTLGDLLSLEYGKPLKDEDRDGHGYPVFGSAGQVGLHSKPLLPTGPNIVVGRKGTAGAVIWTEHPCSVIDTAYFVRQKVEDDLMFTYLLLGNADLPNLAAQTGVPGLNRERAYSVLLARPPLLEQLRIVEIICSVDRVISSTEITIADSRNLRAALLSDLLSGNHEIPTSYDELLGAA